MRPEHITGKKVLYGCLDWGSGHIARSIPLILQLQRQGNRLFFMGSPYQYEILLQYGFAGTFKALPDTGFRFKGDGNFLLEGLRNALILRKSVRRDRERVKAYATEVRPDVIISDHRYGICHDTIPSVFVTHQFHLPPGTHFLANRIHRNWMMRFSERWIMDDPKDSLAGKLSNGGEDAIYIGHYSRFSEIVPEVVPNSLVAVISGPEPYARQLFESMVKIANKRTGFSWTIICGGIYAKDELLPAGRIIHNNWKAADEAMIHAETIISRNGYTTLMDLKTLEKKAILIPTPGQPEQLYLREAVNKCGVIYADSLDDLELCIDRMFIRNQYVITSKE
jgi:methylmalonyl-CoA mutase cobalamin-binding subunit